MDESLNRSFQAKVGAVSGKAAVVGEALRVVSKTDLIIGGIKTAVAGDQFGFAVALESRTRNHVKHAVSAVTVFGRVAAALDFDVIDVFRIELRSNVGRDARVWHGNAIEQPRNLMSAAD